MGFEALARWRHPKRGPLPPAEFMPVSERAGLTSRIDAHLRREALGVFEAMRGMGLPQPHLQRPRRPREAVVPPGKTRVPAAYVAVLAARGPGQLELTAVGLLAELHHPVAGVEERLDALVHGQAQTHAAAFIEGAEGMAQVHVETVPVVVVRGVGVGGLARPRNARAAGARRRGRAQPAPLDRSGGP